MSDDGTIFHFSVSNPRGPQQGSVPNLLRRVADALEAMGPLEVQDLAFSSQVDEDGEDDLTLTVYYHRPDGPPDATTVLTALRVDVPASVEGIYEPCIHDEEGNLDYQGGAFLRKGDAEKVLATWRREGLGESSLNYVPLFRSYEEWAYYRDQE